MVFNQLFVCRDKPLEEIGQTLKIMRASLVLIRRHSCVVFLYKMLTHDPLHLHEHLGILLAVALVQALQLAIRNEALAVGEEKRFEDDVLEQVPG